MIYLGAWVVELGLKLEKLDMSLIEGPDKAKASYIFLSLLETWKPN